MEKRTVKSGFRRFTATVMKTSLRLKIALSVLLAFIIIIPSVAMSLIYLTSILDSLSEIIDNDVKLGRIASELSVTMLDIRRDERNYRLFGGGNERVRVFSGMAQADSLIKNARALSERDEAAVCAMLSNDLEIYRNSFLMLVEHISNEPPESDSSLRRQLSGRIGEFQKVYHSIISRLDSASTAERDSILADANRDLDIFSLDLMSYSDEKEQPSYIRENLEVSSKRFLENAKRLANMSWSAMQVHREDTSRFDARAKRNIVTVLILTLFTCIVLALYLPNLIVSPVKSLMRVFARAGDGDLTAVAAVQSHDEIGDLAKSYNRMIERLVTFDNLKKEKIASQKRMIDRFLETLDLPACIMTEKYIAIFYNREFTELFDCDIPSKAPEAGLDIKLIPCMADYFSSLRKSLSESTNNFIIEIAGSDGATVCMKGRIVRNAHMNMEYIVMVETDKASHA